MTERAAELYKVLKWKRRGLAIAMAVAAVVTLVLLGGQGVDLLGGGMDGGGSVSAAEGSSPTPVDADVARLHSVMDAGVARANQYGTGIPSTPPAEPCEIRASRDS